MKSILTLLLLVTAPLGAAEIDVWAAASLQDALRELGRTHQQRTGDRVTFNFAGSSTLAMQIRAGARADLFFSADEAKMDALAKEGLVVAGTRVSLLSNTLVIASSRAVRRPNDLLRMRRIAIGEPAAVPAGIYAREWLQRLGLWQELRPRVIPTENVRAALAAAEGGSADAAIVYRSDMRVAKRLRVAFEVTGSDAPKISYPVALLRDGRKPAAARKFLAFLQSKEAAVVFRRHGFVVVRS